MSEETIFVGLVLGVCMGAFVVSGLIELLALKKFEYIKNGKTFQYVLASNLASGVLSALLAATTLGLFLLLFAAALGGGTLIAFGTILAFVLLVLATPALFFCARLIAQKALGISREEISRKYSILVSVANLIFAFVFLIGFFSVLTGISNVANNF